MNLHLLQNLVLTPALVLFLIFFFYKLTKRNFQLLRLGAIFFLFAFSLLAYFYLNQITLLFTLPDAAMRVYPWAQKLFIFIIILSGSIITLKIFDEIIFNKYLFRKADIHVPTLFRDIIIFTLLTVIILIIIRIEFGIRLSGILTSSAIVSVIIGLALQDTLANIIAGIVLHIEKPFKIGDWIKIGQQEGEVVEISWRATRLRTMDGNYIVIPNTNISKDIVLNYYEPDKAHAITFNIGIEYTAAPNRVKEVILKAIQDCHLILKNPHPVIYTQNYGDHAIQYEIKIWIDNHAQYKSILDDVMTKLWYSFKRNDIRIPFPIRTVYIQKEEQDKIDTSIESRKRSISTIELFQGVSEHEIQQIAESAKLKHFTKGERIIIQGEHNYSLYIIVQGQVGVFSIDAKGNSIPVKDLKEGEYFGEMSLLTGEKRSATIIAQNEVTLLEIGPNDILPTIKKNPALMEALSKKLAERKLSIKDILDKALANEKFLEKEALSKNLLNRIREFFSIK